MKRNCLLHFLHNVSIEGHCTGSRVLLNALRHYALHHYTLANSTQTAKLQNLIPRQISGYMVDSQYMTYQSRMWTHVHITMICRQHVMSGPVAHKTKKKHVISMNCSLSINELTNRTSEPFIVGLRNFILFWSSLGGQQCKQLKVLMCLVDINP